MFPVPVSAAPDIAWPAIPRPESAMVLAVVQQLEHSQWWPQDKLWAMQRLQLARLVAHAVENVPFYSGRLGAPGNAPLTLDRWRELPILARKDIQEAGDTLRSVSLGAEHGRPNPASTSGSTGMPVTVLKTAFSKLFLKAFTIREHLWYGRDILRSSASIRKMKSGKSVYPQGSRISYWGMQTKGLFPTGPKSFLNIMTPIEQQAEWLQRQNPDYLITFPSNLEVLARHCLEHGITVPGLRDVKTFGEALSPGIREVCRDAWGVEIFDAYGALEVGLIAAQCPGREHYHVMSEHLLVEILDDGGNPCGPGEIGKVVLTDMHNFASPLIRYEIGDYAEVGEPCPCGRGLPVLNRIIGRVRNMMTLPSGEIMQPAFDYIQFTDIAPIRQMQLVQKAGQQIEFRLVVDHDLDAGQERALRDFTVKQFGFPAEVTLVYMDEIPRNAGGKFEDFISEVTAGGN